MPKNLQAEFEAAQKSIDEILSVVEKEDRPLTDEEKATLKGHEDSRDAAKAEIDERNAVALARKRQQDAKAWATSPQGRVSQIGTPPQEEAKTPAFISRKWMSGGSLVSFLGDDAQDQAYYAGKFYAASLFKSRKAAEWCSSHGMPLEWDTESLVATEGSNVKGGYLVPAFLDSAIVRLRETYGVLRQNADVVPMSTETYQVPRETGDVTAYFVGEGDEITASDSAYDAITLTARKIAALCKVSSELAEDAMVSMADRITRSIAYAFAKKEDDCGFLGTGTLATYGGITGLITACAAATATVYTGITGNTAYSTLDLADFEAMVGQLPTYAMPGAKWYMHKAGAWASMFRLQDAAGGNNVQNIAGGPALSFLGFPVVLVPSMNSTLTAQTSTAGGCYFGDMRQAVKLGDRRGITVASSMDRYFELDLLAIRATQRFDINCANVGSTAAAGSLIMLTFPGS